MMKRFFLGCAAAMAVATIGSAAYAAPTGTAVATNGGTITGQNASNATTFTGTFNEGVYKDSASNGYDFVFNFTNNTGSANPVSQIQVSNFAGFSPVASTSTAQIGSFSGGTAPTSFTVSGGVVTFDFSGLSGGGLAAGQSSSNLIVSTTATSFSNTGSFAVQGGGGNNTSLSTQSAISAAPEPGQWALMLGGVAFFGLMLRRQNRRRETGSSLTVA